MRVEWLTLSLIFLCYALWLIAGTILYPIAPVISLLLMALLTAWHSSLSHEALHGHPTTNSVLNEALVFLPLMIFFPYRRYRATHIAHHHDQTLTDPFDDPESYYLTPAQYQKIPPFLEIILKINQTLLGRVTIGPFLSVVKFLKQEATLFLNNSKDVRLAWFLHMPAAIFVLWVVDKMGISVFLYLGICVWLSLSLILVRSYAEHRWHALPEARTLIIEKSLLSLLFLNNNLHLVHHCHPNAPWYALPDLYNQNRKKWRKRNKGYVYANYWQLWRAWAFKAKEKIIHPSYS